MSSQIKASFSHDGKIIISGDEKNFSYFWETETHYKIFSHASGKGNVHSNVLLMLLITMLFKLGNNENLRDIKLGGTRYWDTSSESKNCFILYKERRCNNVLIFNLLDQFINS